MAVKELDIDILLTGQEAVIRKVAAENGISLDRMEIAEAPDVITMDDSPKSIMKEKSQCSLAEGLRRPLLFSLGANAFSYLTGAALSALLSALS